MDFTDYMEQLADRSARLKLSSLQGLSRLTADQQREFEAAWPRIDVRRRRRIVQELTDLSEDNVELDFDAVFTRGLSDDDSSVRLQSVRGLWEHEGNDIVGPLLQLIERDPDAAVRAEAALALGRFVVLAEGGKLRERHFRRIEAGLQSAIEKEDEELEVRARALEAIGAHDDTWVRQAISHAYESGVGRWKVSAVHAMGRSCEERWRPLVLKELSNEEPEVRYEAAIACGSIGDDSAIPSLARLVVDPDEEVKEAAIMALGEIGGREAKAALTMLVGSESEAVREAATAALAELEFEEDPLSLRYRFPG